MRQAHSGIYGYGPYDQQPAPTGQGGQERLNGLRNAIASIEQRIGSMERPVVPAFDQPRSAFPQFPRAAQQSVQPPYAHQPQQQATFAGGQPSMQEQLNRMAMQAGHAAQHQHQPHHAAIQHGAMQHASPAPQMAPQADMQNAVLGIAKQMGALKDELSNLKREVAKPVAVKTSVPQEEVDRIASAIALMQREDRIDPGKFDALAAQLDGLRASMKEDLANELKQTIGQKVDKANQREERGQQVLNQKLERLALGLAEVQKAAVEAGRGNDAGMSEKLDGLARGLDAISHHAAATVTPRVDELAGQVGAMRETLDDLPQTLAITRLEDSLSGVASKIEQLTEAANASVSASHHMLKKSTEQPEGALSAHDLAQIEGRLDEIARAVVAVSNMGRDKPEAAPVDLSGVERIEARMAELARTVDHIAEAANAAQNEPAPGPDPMLNDIAVRIDGLTDRLGSFEKYAQAGDLGGANALFAAPDTGQIEEQLRQLNARLDTLGQPGSAAGDAAQFQQIEAHISALAHQIEMSAQMPQQPDPALASMEEHLARLTQRVEEAAATNSTASQMSNLEAQVGQIMRALAKQTPAAAPAVDLSPLEHRLAGIEGHLSGSESVALEAARHAAEQAVAMVGADTQQGQTVQALASDLQRLQQITESGTSQTHQLHDTLQAMMGRLQSIEDSVAEGNAMRASVPYGAAATMPVAASLQDTARVADPAAHDRAMQDHAERTVFAADALMEGTSDGESPLHRAALASGFVEAPSIDPVDTMEDGFAADTILEPGAPAPVLEPVSEAAPSVVGDVRPDAVAAARRALQATTAEMGAARAAAKDEGKKAKKGGDSALAALKDKLGPLVSKDKAAKASGSSENKTKKPIMIAAAAALLALVAFQGYSMMSGGAPELASDQTIEMTDDVAMEPQAEISDDTDYAAVDTNDNETNVRDVSVETFTVPVTQPDIASVSDTEASAVETPVVETPSAASVADAPLAEAAPAEMPSEVAAVDPELVAPVVAEPEAVAVPDAPVFDVPAGAGPAALVAAATAGEPKALFEIGMRYSNGRGVSRDLVKAAGWFEKAANLGFAPAQYSYGSMLEKNIGVAKDVAAAAKWYEKAAEQGNARAMHNLAVINAMGAKPDVQPDMDRAVGFFTKAANLGIKDSQFNLGILFGQGMGVPQDLGQAYKWFAVAAKTGDADAASKRDEVAGMMGAGELERAREAVANWQAGTLVEAANRVTIPEAWKGQPGKPVAADKDMIMGAQALLNQRGFDVGTPDGMVGPRTTRAIMEFQRSAGIPVTGQVDAPLIKALNI